MCHVVASEMDNYEPCMYTDRVLEAVKVLRDQGEENVSPSSVCRGGRVQFVGNVSIYCHKEGDMEAQEGREKWERRRENDYVCRQCLKVLNDGGEKNVSHSSVCGGGIMRLEGNVGEGWRNLW